MEMKSALNVVRRLVYKLKWLETEALFIAAREWGRVRNLGKPTADPKALDGDVILAG